MSSKVLLVCSEAGVVSSAKAHALLKGGATLLDVRTTEELADGRLHGAINGPTSELRPKARPSVVYDLCAGRNRAAQQLREAGFTHVHDPGAMKRWPQQQELALAAGLLKPVTVPAGTGESACRSVS